MFDGRNDLIFFIGIMLLVNSFKVFGNLDNRLIVQDEVLLVVFGQDIVVVEICSEFLIGIEVEIMIVILIIEIENVVDEVGVIGINVLNE